MFPQRSCANNGKRRQDENVDRGLTLPVRMSSSVFGGQGRSVVVVDQGQQPNNKKQAGWSLSLSALEESNRETHRTQNRRTMYSLGEEDDDDDDQQDLQDSINIQPGATAVRGIFFDAGSNSMYTTSSSLMQEDIEMPSSTAATPITRMSDVELSSTPTIEAEIVDPDLEEDRVRRELIRELKEATPAATVVSPSTDPNSSSSSGQNSKWKTIIVSAVTTFLVALMVVFVTILVVAASKKTSSKSLDDPTSAPSAAEHPTATPTTQMPTSFWTEINNDDVSLRKASLEGKAENDQFGRALAFSRNGDVLAVGAVQHDFMGNGAAGEVQIFRRQENVQQIVEQQQQQQQPWVPLGQGLGGDAPGDIFGISVALSQNGTIVALGGIGSDQSGHDHSGRVKVFTLKNDDNGGDTATSPTWAPLGQPIDGPSQNHSYGNSIALSADGLVLAIGTGVGEAIVYRFDHGQGRWNQIGDKFNGGFGNIEVDLSANGMILAVGSFSSNLSAGFARMYQYVQADNAWRQIGREIAGDKPDTRVGSSVSLSADGMMVAVGASFHDRVWNYDNGGGRLTRSGQVSVFRFVVDEDDDEQPSSWVLVGQPLEGTAENDYFGVSVSLSDDGQILLVGASQQFASENPPGYACAYRLVDDDNAWVQVGETQTGVALDDDFGYSVAVSGNGRLFTIGAPQFRSSGDVDKHHFGYVRVLEAGGATF